MNTFSQPVSVVLTHPMGDDDLLYKGLVASGVDVTCDPMINTEPLALADECLEHLYQSRRIIFTSKRGVEYFFQQLKPADVLDKSFICVGKKTAQVLERHGVKPWWVSGGRTASDLVDELKQAHVQRSEKWVGMLGELAENTLTEGLKDVCNYKRYNIYRTILTSEPNARTLELLQAKVPIMVVCTSPSCFNAFMNLYQAALHPGVHFASIGPVTTRVMKKNGIEPTLIARLSTYESLWFELKQLLKLQY